MKYPRTWAVIGSVALVAGIAIGIATGTDDEVTERGFRDYAFSGDGGDVYVGNRSMIRRPATVDTDRVYAQIAEYGQARSFGNNHPKYLMFMKKATKRFTDAVAKAARANNRGFVTRTGLVTPKRDGIPEPIDLTDEAIRALD